MSLKIFGARGYSLTKLLPRDVPLRGGDNLDTTFWGAPPLIIWEGKNCSKLGSISDNFRLWPQMSLKRSELSKME